MSNVPEEVTTGVALSNTAMRIIEQKDTRINELEGVLKKVIECGRRAYADGRADMHSYQLGLACGIASKAIGEDGK